MPVTKKHAIALRRGFDDGLAFNVERSVQQHRYAGSSLEFLK